MNFINSLRIKSKEHQYRKYIEKHRQDIQRAFVELVMSPGTQYLNWTEDLYTKLKERANNHDLSKFEKNEFDAYRKNYYPINDIERKTNKQYFNEAVDHHYRYNRHHWQARQYDANIMTEDIKLDCLENIMDWLAVGYRFHNEPIEYYNKYKNTIILPAIQRQFMEEVMLGLHNNKWIDKGERV